MKIIGAVRHAAGKDAVYFLLTSYLESFWEGDQPTALCAYLLTTAIFALCIVTSSAAADLLTGRVVHVIDGDSLIVLLGDRRVNVRLEHIDAPEKGQPYGTASRQSLIAICGGELANVQASGKDRNGWTLARVRCNGTDAGSEQVRRGMAWVFDRYAPADTALYSTQAEARAARRGIWAQQEPVPPWEWRHPPGRKSTALSVE